MLLKRIINLRLPSRITFKFWLDLESLKEKAFVAAESSRDEFPDLILRYLSAATRLPIWAFDKLFWLDLMEIFDIVAQRIAPAKDIPLLKYVSKNELGNKIDWNYDNRTWYYWAHLLAAAYGWSLEYIASLEVTDALLHIQEILTSEQLEHEFDWALSEVAYPYNKNTKRQDFKPLPRPYWMLPSIENRPVKKIRIPKDMMPVGAIEDLSGIKPDALAD